MFLVEFVRAIITRGLFVIVALLGIWRVTWVKNSDYYWYLIVLFLPLLIEVTLTLQNQEATEYKWVSPPIFLFLTSIIPSIWILEIDQSQNKDKNPKCLRFDSWDSVKNFVNKSATEYKTNEDYIDTFENIFTSICPGVWILAFHQIILILLIVGKWLLPLGSGTTREELSQLLISFVGTAADILEFTSETLSDIKGKNPILVYIILSVWTWSMLQFPFHLSVGSTHKEDANYIEVKPMTVCEKHGTDILGIMESTLTQDGPFLVVRVTIIIYYRIFHQMLVFFAIKNVLVVLLSVYRMYVICRDFKPPEVHPVQALTPAAPVEVLLEEGRLPPDDTPGPSHLARTQNEVQPGIAHTAQHPTSTSKSKSALRTVSKYKKDHRTCRKAKSDSIATSKASADSASISTVSSDPETPLEATEEPTTVTKKPRTVTKAKSYHKATANVATDSTIIKKSKSDPKRALKATTKTQTVPKVTPEPQTVPKATPDPSPASKATKNPRTVTKTKSDSIATSKVNPGSTSITKAKSHPKGVHNESLDQNTASKTTKGAKTVTKVSKAKSGRRTDSKAKTGSSPMSEDLPGPSTVSAPMPDPGSTSEIEEGNG